MAVRAQTWWYSQRLLQQQQPLPRPRGMPFDHRAIVRCPYDRISPNVVDYWSVFGPSSSDRSQFQTENNTEDPSLTLGCF